MIPGLSPLLHPSWFRLLAVPLFALAAMMTLACDDADTRTPTLTPTVPSPTATTPPPTGTPANRPITTGTPVPTVDRTPAVTPEPGADWPTYGFDNAHTGFNPREAQLGVENVGNLANAWSIDLGGWITDQPVFASAVDVPGRGAIDLLYVGTEKGDFFAIDVREPLPADIDRIAWSTNVGAGECDHGINGVTGTPTIDRATGRVYVVGGRAEAFAFDLATGELALGWPVKVTETPELEKVWSGGTIANGLYYTATGGYCGDETKTPYRSSVVAIDIETAEVVHRWYPLGADGPYGGGIWSPAAVSVDDAGKVYVAGGNANIDPESFAFGEHIVRLSASLEPEASHFPNLTGFDVDFSSAPVLFEAPGCPLSLVAMAKTGELFLYDAAKIDAGPLQTELVASGLGLFLGMPAYSPETNMVYVSIPDKSAKYMPGMAALEVTAGCGLRTTWQQTRPPEVAIVSPPTLANGVAYHTTGMGNQVYAFDAATGDELWNSGDFFKARLPAAPIVVNGRLYIGSWDNQLYAFGVPDE